MPWIHPREFVMQYQCPIILKCYSSKRENGIPYRIHGVLLSSCVWRGMGVQWVDAAVMTSAKSDEFVLSNLSPESPHTPACP